MHVKTVEENERTRGMFYPIVKKQDHNNIEALVEYGHCLVVGNGKWKVISDIRYEDMEEYECIGVRDFILITQVRQIRLSLLS